MYIMLYITQNHYGPCEIVFFTNKKLVFALYNAIYDRISYIIWLGSTLNNNEWVIINTINGVIVLDKNITIENNVLTNSTVIHI